MAFRNILSWPDENLRKISEPVAKFDDNLRKLAADLYDTLNVVTGVGLAAPQIGVHQRCVIVDAEQCEIENPVPENGFPPNIMVLVNPELQLSGSKHKWVEACLSVPDARGQVERQQLATITYYSLDGSKHVLNLDWPAAGVFQHECDHLDGKLYIDRMSSLARSLITTKITKKRKRIAEVREMMHAQERKELDAIHGVSHTPATKQKSSAEKEKRSAKKNRPSAGRKK